jgi:hypothetical protein
MTLSRDVSLSSLHIPSRASVDLCLHVVTLRVQLLEMFKSAEYQDISLAEWMAHTPHLLMNQHLQVGMPMLDGVPKDEMVIVPV